MMVESSLVLYSGVPPFLTKVIVKSSICDEGCLLETKRSAWSAATFRGNNISFCYPTTYYVVSIDFETLGTSSMKTNKLPMNINSGGIPGSPIPVLMDLKFCCCNSDRTVLCLLF